MGVSRFITNRAGPLARGLEPRSFGDENYVTSG